MVIVAKGLMVPRFLAKTGIGCSGRENGKAEGVSPSKGKGLIDLLNHQEAYTHHPPVSHAIQVFGTNNVNLDKPFSLIVNSLALSPDYLY
jgi:hypothetical protein